MSFCAFYYLFGKFMTICVDSSLDKFAANNESAHSDLYYRLNDPDCGAAEPVTNNLSSCSEKKEMLLVIEVISDKLAAMVITCALR